MTHGSLFSGIGGFDLAAEWMGWDNLFHCEWNPFGQRVLKYYWPNAESYGDIKKSDFTKWRGLVDVVSGGFPCQPYSLAGKRKGKADDRHLWPGMLRAIKEIQPRWVVGENVFGLINWSGGLVFHEVQTDLEAAGYEVWPYVLPACAKNAPHRRDRVWFVAHNNSDGGQEYGRGVGQKAAKDKGQNGCGFFNSYFSNGKEGLATNTDNKRLQGGEINGNIRESREKRNKQPTGLFQSDWEKFPTQFPVCSGNDGFPSGLDGITVSKHREESLMAYGNAVVPQVVYEIFKAIEYYELRF